MVKPAIAKLSGRSVAMPDKVRASYYATPEHMAWSNQIRERAGFQCQQCGRRGVRLFADHIVEIRDGGTWDMANGQALCGSCHTAKSVVERARRAFNPIK
jgi:5-methylcytosine-specific restriction protein A